MTPRTVTGSARLGELIRKRRDELGLTIEEAARAGGVGSESWRRYEGGGSIRQDKVRGICKALRWRTLPAVDDVGEESVDADRRLNVELADAVNQHASWMVDAIGADGVLVLSYGLEISLDQIRMDLDELARRPRGAHLGEIPGSLLLDDLPEQWVTRYDYEFVYRFRCTIERLRLRAVHDLGWDGTGGYVRSVADDIALYVVMETGAGAVGLVHEETEMEIEYDWLDWYYQLNGEDDRTVPALYSSLPYLKADALYIRERSDLHFDRWFNDDDALLPFL